MELVMEHSGLQGIETRPGKPMWQVDAVGSAVTSTRGRTSRCWRRTSR